jgi:integrase
MTPKFTKHVRNRSKAVQTLTNFVATKLAISFLSPGSKKDTYPLMKRHLAEMTLHGRTGAKKYLNLTERRKFRQAAQHSKSNVRLFCFTLMWSGGRISELLALTPAAVDLDRALITLVTLKRRRRMFREIPLPAELLRDLNHLFDIRGRQQDINLAHARLWPWSRTTAWRRIKEVMACANLYGQAAMPKGLRHTFGVYAFAVAPPHLVQRWMGHASLRTTAIYGEVSGAEERAFASQMWQR